MVFWEKKLNTRFEAGAITWLAYQFNEEPLTQDQVKRLFEMYADISVILRRLFDYPPNSENVRRALAIPSRYERAMDTIKESDSLISP